VKSTPPPLNPLMNLFGYFPPSPLDTIYREIEGDKEESPSDVFKVENFIKKLEKYINKFRRD
jgi:hypothetical protein